MLLSTYDSRGGAALETIGLPPVGNVRDYIFGADLWLAADPVLAPWPGPAGLGVVPTGAWFVPDERPLPAGTVAARLLLDRVSGETSPARPEMMP